MHRPTAHAQSGTALLRKRNCLNLERRTMTQPAGREHVVDVKRFTPSRMSRVLEVRSVPTAGVTSDIGFFRGPEGAQQRPRGSGANSRPAMRRQPGLREPRPNPLTKLQGISISGYRRTTSSTALMQPREISSCRTIAAPEARPTCRVVPAGTFGRIAT